MSRLKNNAILMGFAVSYFILMIIQIFQHDSLPDRVYLAVAIASVLLSVMQITNNLASFYLSMYGCLDRLMNLEPVFVVREKERDLIKERIKTFLKMDNAQYYLTSSDEEAVYGDYCIRVTRFIRRFNFYGYIIVICTLVLTGMIDLQIPSRFVLALSLLSFALMFLSFIIDDMCGNICTKYNTMIDRMYRTMTLP